MSPVRILTPQPLAEPDITADRDGGSAAPSLSTFLHGRTPTRLRGLMFLALDESALILTPQATSDIGGGVSTSWGTAGTAACRIDPAGGAGMRVAAGKLDETATHMITVPPTAEVLETDRFVIAGRGTFEVLAVHLRTGQTVQRFEVIQTS
jgi:hypothetical protein